jgi:hypothetical protein
MDDFLNVAARIGALLNPTPRYCNREVREDREESKRLFGLRALRGLRG